MTPDPSASPTAGPTGGSRRRVVAAVVVVVVVVAVIIVAKLASGHTSTTPSAAASGSPSPSAGASSPATSATPGPSVSASGTATPATPTRRATTPATPTPSVTTRETPKVLQTHKPVPIKTAAPFGDGVTAKIVGVVPVQSVAQGPGEISGPAIKVTISLKNGTKDAISVNQVTINVSYGKQASPASDIQGDPAAKPFHGTVGIGAIVRGTYVFDVPKNQRSDVSISVSYEALSPIVVFAGAVK
jgi:hypothetical protein